VTDEVTLRIRPMTFDDLPAVHLIERASFSTPWPPHAYRQELATNRLAHYLVVERRGEVIAYGGVWVMVDEAHVTTFAVHPRYRRQGIGERLLLALLDLSIERHAREATLEVRLSNLPARRLYEKYGFRPVGIRPRYYSDNGEDGLIMTTEPLTEPPMQSRISRLRADLDTGRRLEPIAAPPTEDGLVGAQPALVPGDVGRAAGAEREGPAGKAKP
jgi:ribosomal-protein-alanine N-acetyltransferase